MTPARTPGRTRSLLGLSTLSLAVAVVLGVRAYSSGDYPFGVGFFTFMAIGFAIQARKNNDAVQAAERARMRDAAWRIDADRRITAAGDAARARIAAAYPAPIDVGEVAHHPDRGNP